MEKFFIPAKSPIDWKQLLAEPEKHWKTGYSAKALAYCWQEAQGFPESVVMEGVVAEVGRVWDGGVWISRDRGGQGTWLFGEAFTNCRL